MQTPSKYLTQNKLSDIQKSFWNREKHRAYEQIVIDNRELYQYSLNFVNSLPTKIRSSSAQKILHHVSKNHIVLFGDFHTFAKTQESFLEFVRRSHAHSPQREISISLEAFTLEDQPYIDSFLANKISEEKFLAKTFYFQNWGFPWEKYRDMFALAKSKHWKIYGINPPRKKVLSLLKRDQFIAQQLQKINHISPNGLNLCLIGELHLGENHLPKILAKKQIKTLRILNNLDEYYFQLLDSKKILQQEEILYLKKDLYCVINAPPWMKWLSYTNWEESQNELQINIEDSQFILEENNTTLDFDYYFLELAMHLANLLSLKFSKLEINNFDIYTVEDIEDIKDKLSNPHNLSFLLEDFQTQGFVFDPHAKILFIKDTTPDLLAGACGEFLYSLIRRETSLQENAKSILFDSLLSSCMNSFASKIFNPQWHPIYLKPQIYRSFLSEIPDLNHIKRQRALARSLGQFLGNSLYSLFIKDENKFWPRFQEFFLHPSKNSDSNLKHFLLSHL